MGICSVDPHFDENREDNRDIDRNYARAHKKDRQIKKLLLLGSGSSGKSTLFKQLKCIYTEDGLAKTVFIEARRCIRQNVMIAMLKLLNKSQEFASMGINKYTIDMTDKHTIECVQFVAKFGDKSFDEPLFDWDIMKQLGEYLQFLWNLPVIKDDTFCKRNVFAIPDNIEYFFNKVNELFTELYIPSMEDVLKCRVKTAGMIEVKYRMKNHDFHIYDVGGQRSERKKWIFCFESVCAVLFVAALNAYYSVIFEDEGVNAMHESIQLFDELINSKWFRKADIILFLNKNDLFVDLIRNGVSLSHCFTTANKWKGVQWTGKDFNEKRVLEEMHIPNISTNITPIGRSVECKTDDENIVFVGDQNQSHDNQQSVDILLRKKKNEHFMENSMDIKRDFSSVNISIDERKQFVDDDCKAYMPTFDGNQHMLFKFMEYYENALEFITQRYLERDVESKNRIYWHVTTATDVGIIEKVFLDVQNIVVRENLHRTGLY